MKRLQEEAFDSLAFFESMPTDTENAGGTYDPLTEVITPPANISDASRAILACAQLDNDAKAFAAAGMQIVDGLTLRVEANGVFEPNAGMTVTFPYPAGRKYSVKSAKPKKQGGAPQFFTVLASA